MNQAVNSTTVQQDKHKRFAGVKQAIIFALIILLMIDHMFLGNALLGFLSYTSVDLNIADNILGAIAFYITVLPTTLLRLPPGILASMVTILFAALLYFYAKDIHAQTSNKLKRLILPLTLLNLGALSISYLINLNVLHIQQRSWVLFNAVSILVLITLFAKQKLNIVETVLKVLFAPVYLFVKRIVALYNWIIFTVKKSWKYRKEQDAMYSSLYYFLSILFKIVVILYAIWVAGWLLSFANPLFKEYVFDVIDSYLDITKILKTIIIPILVTFGFTTLITTLKDYVDYPIFQKNENNTLQNSSQNSGSNTITATQNNTENTSTSPAKAVTKFVAQPFITFGFKYLLLPVALLSLVYLVFDFVTIYIYKFAITSIDISLSKYVHQGVGILFSAMVIVPLTYAFLLSTKKVISFNSKIVQITVVLLNILMILFSIDFILRMMLYISVFGLTLMRSWWLVLGGLFLIGTIFITILGNKKDKDFWQDTIYTYLIISLVWGILFMLLPWQAITFNYNLTQLKNNKQIDYEYFYSQDLLTYTLTHEQKLQQYVGNTKLADLYINLILCAKADSIVTKSNATFPYLSWLKSNFHYFNLQAKELKQYLDSINCITTKKQTLTLLKKFLTYNPLKEHSVELYKLNIQDIYYDYGTLQLYTTTRPLATVPTDPNSGATETTKTSDSAEEWLLPKNTTDAINVDELIRYNDYYDTDYDYQNTYDYDTYNNKIIKRYVKTLYVNIKLKYNKDKKVYYLDFRPDNY